MHTLSIRGLARRFGSRVVFDDVTFDLEAGTATALLGPNGAGKSTLLRCIVAADQPDGGEVLFEGRPYDETDAGLRAAVATVLDDVEFFPDLSAVEHLELLARAHGGTGDSVDAVLVELGLEPARDQLPATLSSGQRRRLALASCFVRPRRLLLLDEPEQRLDVAGRQWLAARLLREKASGTAILLASHDHELVDAVADHRIELGPPPLA
jgi:ABC-type multidrug transport system ATPase subunit